MRSEWKSSKWQVKLCGLEPSMPAQQQSGILRQLIHESRCCHAHQPCCIVVAMNKDGGNDHAYLHYNHPQRGFEEASQTCRFFVKCKPTTFGKTITAKLIGPPRAQEPLTSQSYDPPWAPEQNTRAENTYSRIDEIHKMRQKMQELESNVAELHKTMQESAPSKKGHEVLNDIMDDYCEATNEFQYPDI
jgi:hypothetical protein